MKLIGLLGLVLLALGCSDSSTEVTESSSAAPNSTPAIDAATADDEQCVNATDERMALFGDLHVHTSFSFDAAANSIGSTPADAQRFARGESIDFFPLDEQGKPSGKIQIDRPLDFLAVTDHGEFLGERSLCRTAGSPMHDTKFCVDFRADQRQGMMMLGTVITTETPKRIPALCGADGSLCLEFAKSPWEVIQEAANSANDPCEFTSFVGYEYTGTPGTSNYHRNVIFRGSAVPELPVSYIDAPIDSRLWTELDARCTSAMGCDYLTIPHNTNLANGRMAPYRKLEPTDANKISYANKRLQREPIMEIFQHKGGSECINGLSSVLGAPDELCNVEAVRRMGEEKTYATRDFSSGELVLGQAMQVTAECEPGTTGNSGMLGAGCVDATDFQRSALLVGLEEEQRLGVNPVKLGVIASTDTHTATPGATVESTWRGAVTGEATSAERLQSGVLTSGIDGNPGGLAGVWAKQNTREAVFAAMLRREVFGTSGPRIKPRLFAGWDYPADLCEQNDWVKQGYAKGVPMGSDLLPKTAAGAPKFLAYAAQDPAGQGLDRLELIKGWIDEEGQRHNQVIPVATSGTKPASSLCNLYTDSNFDPAQPAYYYLRVVEPFVQRWHTYDCAALPEAERPAVCTNGEYPETVAEMAWTSPIWYQPPAAPVVAAASQVAD